MLELTEEDALQRLRAQDPAALSWLIGRYNRYVASIVCAVLGARCRPQDAEELTADVFYSVFRRAEAISPGKLQAYLGAAARNRAKDFLRKQAPIEADLDTVTLPDGANAPEQELLRRERQGGNRGNVPGRPGNLPSLLLLLTARAGNCAGNGADARRSAHQALARQSRTQKNSTTGGCRMDVKITDLLDDFEDGWLPLPAPKHPTHTQTERLVKQRLGVSRRWMRPARKALLAAAISLPLALGVLAGALSLLQRSRIDLGVDNPDAIAEYSEYDAAEQNTAGAQLLSSFCAGKRLIAYISVPDVTAEMNSAYRTAMDTYGMSLWSCRAKPYSVWAKQLSYDEAAQTALLRVELRADEALAPGEVTVELCFDSQENGRETTGALVDTVAVPIAPSASLQATPELTLSSSFLEADAAVQTLALDAGTLRVTLQAPRLNDYLAARGEGALDALVKGYFGQDTEHPTELDAQVAYRRSWNRALNEAFTNAVILYTDGTEDDLAALFENEQSFFSPALVETLESAGIYSFEAALKRPVSLPAVRAIRILDVEIPLNK